LAEILPPNELDAWDPIVLDQATGCARIRAFRHWLPPEYAEILRTHFDHPDREWSNCANQAYLSKAVQQLLGGFEEEAVGHAGNVVAHGAVPRLGIVDAGKT
jgi:hypothetical protein